VRDALLAQAPTPTLDTLDRHETAPSAHMEPLIAPEAGTSETAAQTPPSPPSGAEPSSATLPILRIVGQVANTYIVAEGPDGMYLIDQHAAHERVLFENIRDQRQRKAVEIQGMLQPVPAELTVRQQELLESQAEGERTYLIRSVPAMLQGHDVARSLTELLDFLGEGARSDWGEEIAVSLACHSAVLAGQALSGEEMVDLVRQLERASQPRTCPHGRPTMIHLSAAQIEKGFGRR